MQCRPLSDSSNHSTVMQGLPTSSKTSQANTGGGVHGLRMDGGLPSGVRFSERYPLLITETCCHTHFYDEFWRKTTHFWQCFANSLISHPCLWKICRKGDPCLENFSPKTHPYGRRIPVPSTCFVPPSTGSKCGIKDDLTNMDTDIIFDKYMRNMGIDILSNSTRTRYYGYAI